MPANTVSLGFERLRQRLDAYPAVLVTGGQIVAQLLGVLRNVLIARLLGPEQFGIASALAMTISMVELFSDLGVGRNLARTSTANPEDRLAAGHAISAWRGVIGAFSLVLLGPVLASTMRLSEYSWAFSATALVPLGRCFIHYDYWSAQQHHRFFPYLIVELVPQILTVAMVAPLVWWLGDYRVVLITMVVNAFLYLAISHLVASTKYRIERRSSHAAEFRSFGWPLLADGVVLFAVFHGERLLISRYFGEQSLGLYSAAYLLTWTPSQLLSRVALSINIPVFSRPDTGAFAERSIRQAAIWLSLTGGVGCLTVATFGREILTVFFGSNYSTGATLLTVLGCTQVFRCLRIVPTSLSIARGDTRTPLISNIIRAIGVLGTGLLCWSGRSAVEALLAGCLAEFVSTWFLSIRQRASFGISSRTTLACSLLAGAIGVTSIIVSTQELLNIAAVWIKVTLIAFLAAIALAVLIRSGPPMPRYVKTD